MRSIVACALVLIPVTGFTANEFNPDISLILDGKYTHYDKVHDIPGFQPGGETGPPEDGFSLGHSELVMSASIDDRFYGRFAAALEDHEETELEIEEAFLETTGLGQGATIKFGKFLSGIGYLNSKHLHSHNFADVPLVYSAMLGGHMADKGIQGRWVAPLDHLAEIGIEVLRGESFPGGETSGNDNARSVFFKLGNDLSTSASWQFGTFRYDTDFLARETSEHSHSHDNGDGHAEEQNAGPHGELRLHNGDVTLTGLDFVYKWAPNGNATERNFSLQFEVFRRQEDATLEFVEDTASLDADYSGEQRGFYVSSVYQFLPQWRAGLRYDQLEPDNKLENINDNGLDQVEFADETAYLVNKETERSTVMVDYSHTEFSRIRFQYSRTSSPLINGATDDEGIWMVQYVMSMGSHGAHAF